MKKIILSLAVITSLVACGGGETEKKSDAGASAPTSMVESNPNASNPDYEKGLDLVAKNQCTTCHKVDEKLTGPAYREVANKYAGADDAKITELADKIIKGGSGVWGEVPMTPHPNVSEEDAKAMVKYILLLKK
ncbi:MAG: c-type cytochrome [Niabella sp.]